MPVQLDKNLDQNAANSSDLVAAPPAAVAPEYDDAMEGVVIGRDLPAILPNWLTDWEILRTRAELRARRAGHLALFHIVRAPRHGARFVWRGLVGITRGVRTLAGWVFLHESTPLRRKAIADLDARDYLDLLHVRNDHVKVRGLVTLATAAAVATAIAVQAHRIPAALIIEGIVAWAVAAWRGGPVDGAPLLDRPDLPVRLDLNVEHLNSAFRACGLLKGKDDDPDAPSLLFVQYPMKDRKGWSTVFDLPRGGGKNAKDALAKRDVLAAELGVDEVQLDMQRVRSTRGGHAGRISLWLCDDDPYIGESTKSPLETAESLDIWGEVPLGFDARGNRVTVRFLWESAFYGGLMRRGKTAGQRLPVAAGVLDPNVKHYLADGKGGSDWKPMQLVAHRYVLGAEDEAIRALEAMLDEVIDDMEAAYARLRKIPILAQPDAKLTPELCRRYGLQITMVIIDELQEFLTAIADKKRREGLVDRLCRIARRGPAAGFICLFASQRPDAESVPTRLRDIVSIRFCTQVKDRTSSDMVLGEGKARQGADASILSEDHLGVGVLCLSAENHIIVKHDYLDLPAFLEICKRGRRLREAARTLTGDATDDTLSGVALETIPQALSDALTLMRHMDKIHSFDLLNRMVNFDADSYGDWGTDRLAEELEAAGVRRTTKQVKIDGRNLNGYWKSDLMAAAEQYERPP